MSESVAIVSVVVVEKVEVEVIVVVGEEVVKAVVVGEVIVVVGRCEVAVADLVENEA